MIHFSTTGTGLQVTYHLSSNKTNLEATMRQKEGSFNIVAYHWPVMNTVQTCEPNLTRNSQLLCQNGSKYCLLTSRPIVVLKVCIWGVTAFKVISSSGFAFGMTSTNLAIVSIRTFFAQWRLASIGVSRTLVSYEKALDVRLDRQLSNKI